jgi:hypothetical protein
MNIQFILYEYMVNIWSILYENMVNFLLLCWVGAHCGIYKGFYNVSNTLYLNSPSPLLSFIPPLLLFEQFQQVSFLHLCTCVHIFCTIFTLLHLFPITSLCSVLLFSNFVEEKNIKDSKKRNMEFLLV